MALLAAVIIVLSPEVARIIFVAFIMVMVILVTIASVTMLVSAVTAITAAATVCIAAQDTDVSTVMPAFAVIDFASNYPDFNAVICFSFLIPLFLFRKFGALSPNPFTQSTNVHGNGGHNKMKLEPVFLIASVRSGSTLLHLMLDAHPDITNPGECDFLFDQVADDGTLPDNSRYREWLKTNRYFLAMKLDVNPAFGYLALVSSFVDQMRKNNSVVMNIHRNFYRIPKIFPHGKYIHLVRDGRDVARSCINMGWAGNLYHGIDIWRDAEIAWDLLRETLHPWQYIEIRYEDLLENVESGLKKICEFVGLDYSRSMMNYAANSTYSLPDKRLRYQWKTNCGDRELSLAEYKAGKMLSSRGYELSGLPVFEPGMIEKIYLRIQDKRVRIMYRISILGFSLYLQDYLARKLNLSRWHKSLQTRINAAEDKVCK